MPTKKCNTCGRLIPEYDKQCPHCHGEPHLLSKPGIQKVIIEDIDMHFGSMIKFMVKWAIASVPAILIISIIIAFITSILSALSK